MCFVVIARRPFGLVVVDVLPVWRAVAEASHQTRSVVTSVVGHALGVGVGHLILQSVTHRSSGIRPAASCTSCVPFDWVPETCATSVVIERVRPGLPFAKNGLGAVQGGVAQEVAGSATALAVVERHHQVVRALTDVSNLECGIARELMLNRQVPLVVNRRLNVLDPTDGE